jgi:subtilisin family serine protease
MKRLSRGTAALALLLTAAVLAAGAAEPEVRTVSKGGETVRQIADNGVWFDVVESEITVRFDAETRTLERFRERVAGLSDELAALGDLDLVRVNRLGIHDLRVPVGEDAFELAAHFRATGLVLYAEVPTLGQWVADPNDPRFGDQYALRNTGQSGGLVDADIDADEAWDITAGVSSIVVAVADSGTEYTHVDLAANMWKNPGEIEGNGQDDDNNGYVDDYHGWDFEGNDGDPSSTNGHGTQVAGMVAAVTDNGVGVAGTAGGGFGFDGASVMPLKVGTAGPIGSVLDDAILYAADNGAQIITMSLSVGSSAAINDALDYAYNTKGVFIDCASGNNGFSVSYPANRPEVMAVAASTRTDAKASYSNAGPEVEVAAPGSSILSTGLNNTYTSGSGTSFAAPHVAGTAALLLSYNDTLANTEVRQVLKDTAEDIGSPGFDNGTGWGRINARLALDAVEPPTCDDADGDGFFNRSDCGTAVDCDDSDPSVYPGAPEICDDNIDQDCDGEADEGCCTDNDGDGFSECDGDCDDSDASLYPGAPEICKDGIDQDCDGRDQKGGCDGGSDPSGKENCKNGIDDDGDGAIDCSDSECSGKKFCQ